MSKANDKRFLVIFEDGSLKIFTAIPLEVIDGFNDGILDIVDMQHGTELAAFPDDWAAIDTEE